MSTGSNVEKTVMPGLELQLEAKRELRRKVVVLFVAFLALFAVSLCLSSLYAGVMYSPITVVQALATRVGIIFQSVFDPESYDITLVNDANVRIPGYGDICKRFDITVVTVVGGLLLSLSGMLYQNVFKNPIAAPSMLGVSAGVRIGTILLVVVYGVEALNMEGMRYLYCYIGGVVIIVGVVLFAKLIARGQGINVADMLIVGSVFSQLLATVSTYFLTYIMTDDQYEVFYELTSGMRTSTDSLAFVFLAIVLVVSVLPVVLMRFKLNVIAFNDSDMRMLGVRPELMRVFVLIMGTIMILAAQIHVGVISMVALVVPFLTRYIVGSEFGKQLIGNVLMGPILLLLCRFICGVVPFVNGGMSLEMVVGFVALPIYIWMMALGKRGWE